MKTVNFDKVKVGELVQVPRYQFAPQRRGWNGWLFSDAVVLSKSIGTRTGKQIITVEMMIPGRNNTYQTMEKSCYANCVFETGSLDTAKRFLKDDDVNTYEDFKMWLGKVVGADWISFLFDKGFLTFEGVN